MSLSFFDEIEARGKAEAVLGFLQKKLQRVPKKIETVVRRMSDPIALDSLVAYVVAYKGQDEFAESLK